ncbi:MAG: sulfite exporter TauE/SafE family protein [Planctomycetota bacterium]
MALLLAVCACASFAVGMVTAGGAALILIPIVHWALGAQAIAPVITLGTMSSGLSRILMLKRHIRWDITRWYLPGALLGAFAGARMFAFLVAEESYTELLRWIVGVFLISTLFQYRFGAKRTAFRMRPPAMLPIGIVVATGSGLVGGLGPVLNPFYLNLDAQREEIVATKAFNAFFMHLTKVATYAAFGALDLRLLGYGVALGVGAVLGNLLGRRWLKRIGEKRFRTAVVWMMALSGVLILVRG